MDIRREIASLERQLGAGHIANRSRVAGKKFEKVGKVKVNYDTAMRINLSDSQFEVAVKTLLKKVKDLEEVFIDPRKSKSKGKILLVFGDWMGASGNGSFAMQVKGDTAKLLSFEELDLEEDLPDAALEFIDEMSDDKEMVERIAQALGYELEDIESYTSGGQYGVNVMELSIGGEDYLGFDSYDDAEEYAKARVLELFDDVGVMDFALDFVDENKARSFFEDVYTEWDYSYANDIMSEGSDNDYANRLVDELLDRGIIGERKAEDPDYDGSDDIDEFVEGMVEDKLDEGRGGYDHYADNFGEEEANKLLVDQGLIDLDAAAEYAVRTDGAAHEIASYDGNEIEAEGTYWYRIG